MYKLVEADEKIDEQIEELYLICHKEKLGNRSEEMGDSENLNREFQELHYEIEEGSIEASTKINTGCNHCEVKRIACQNDMLLFLLE